jgi:hypothetical protein
MEPRVGRGSTAGLSPPFAMKRVVNAGLFLFLASFGACAASTSPPLPTPEPEVVAAEPEPEPFAFEAVWSSFPGIAIVGDGGYAVPVPNLFTRLEVVGRDSVGLRVRCTLCPEVIEGYVREDQVVFEPVPPAVAAWQELSAFALAVREAARTRDLNALRRVMAADFSFSFIGPQDPEVALAAWTTEQFRTLDQVPGLLDRGLVTPDDWIWSAPPAFLSDPWYHGVRLGFRRQSDGRWEWIYLIRGIEMAAGGEVDDLHRLRPPWRH